MAILKGVLAIFGSVILALAINEVQAWLPSLAAILIRRAVKLLPEGNRERLAEEWQSHLNDLPGGLSKIICAAGLSTAARRIAADQGARSPSNVAIAIKRLIDMSIVLWAFPLFILLTLGITLALRFSSRGSVFFPHRRIGRDGQFFTMWKFRTMSVNSVEILETYLAANPHARYEWRHFHKLRNDPRVTTIGRFLRRTSLDELPQLWNVFNGSMSLVGPRPIVAAEVEKYGPYFSDYCTVKPGITGLWQTSGSTYSCYEERVRLDRQYALTWSLRGDILILLKTLRSVVDQDGAY
jgi:lipopolysaccharide/colanic/teichoic acid biosynthesis glycosyltransferase